MSDQPVRTERALNRLAKWRVVFTGWQLGTRAKGDPESDAVRDHREVTILLRAESNALIGLLLRKGLITEMEWLAALEREAGDLSKAYEAKFPGFKATDDGMSMSLPAAAETTKGWRP